MLPSHSHAPGLSSASQQTWVCGWVCGQCAVLARLCVCVCVCIRVFVYLCVPVYGPVRVHARICVCGLEQGKQSMLYLPLHMRLYADTPKKIPLGGGPPPSQGDLTAAPGRLTDHGHSHGRVSVSCSPLLLLFGLPGPAAVSPMCLGLGLVSMHNTGEA